MVGAEREDGPPYLVIRRSTRALDGSLPYRKEPLLRPPCREHDGPACDQPDKESSGVPGLPVHETDYRRSQGGNTEKPEEGTRQAREVSAETG